MFKVGDFAKIGQVSVKTLHHYDSAAASSFGGTIWLLWINAAVQKPHATTPAIALTPQRDWFWITPGIVALLVYFLLLGPGLPRSAIF